jgi:hypothetical protein
MFSIYPLYTAPINTEPDFFHNFVPYAEGTKYFRVKVRPDFGLIPNECADYTSLLQRSKVRYLFANYTW